MDNLRKSFFSKNIVAEYGYCNNFPYIIKDYGSHYCVYVGLFEVHPLFGKSEDDYDVLNLDAYGGITYAKASGKYWILGWDYLHDMEENVTMDVVHDNLNTVTLQLAKHCLAVGLNLDKLLEDMKIQYLK